MRHWKGVADMQRQSLNVLWRMHECNTESWHEAVVPGLVYADLMRDGSMPDPFWRDNEHTAFELLKKDYEYRRIFIPDTFDSKRILLRCHGLDPLAHYLSFSYVVSDEIVSEGCALFCAPKHFAFVDPRLQVCLNGKSKLVVCSEAFARFVCIEGDDPDFCSATISLI